jgi:type I restriction enzyme, S subunit
MMSIFNGWEKMKWEDLVTLEYGKGLRDYRNSDGQYPVFGTNGQIGWHHECLCPFAGVIIGRKGAYRGIHYSNSPFFVIDTAFYLKPIIDGSFCVKWAYYQLLDFDINKMDSGSAIPSTSRNAFYAIQLHVPPLSIQYKIAAILSAYDDLIENNLRRIRILEEMAQNLYREWFVKFRFPGHEQARFVDSPLGMIPEGWDVLRVKDIADVNARSIRKEKTPTEIAYVDISSVSSGSINKIETIAFSKAPGRARKVVQHGDMIWSSVRPNLRSFSLIIDPPSNLIVSTGFAVISAKKVPFTFLYQALTTEDFVSYLTNHAKGSAYPAVGTNDFEDACVVVPCRKLLNPFDDEMLPIAIITNRLKAKNTNLRRTRDMLLPRLISGEVDVSELDIAIPEEVAA